MGMDADFSKQLLETFKTELAEKLQIISDSLLKLEKGSLSEVDAATTIKDIFRAAHNIKGAARSLNVQDIGAIAHHIESLFATIQQDPTIINSNLITRCLEAIDGMHVAMDAFNEQKPLPFDLNELLDHLATNMTNEKINDGPSETKKTTVPTPEAPGIQNEYESIRVSLTNLDRISAMMEELQVNKIAIDDHYLELTKIKSLNERYVHLWNQTLLLLQNNSGKELSENTQKLCNLNADQLIEISDGIKQMHKNMHASVNSLTSLFNSMQEDIRQLRLIPAATLLQIMPRTVRDLAQELKKEVALTIRGEDVKIDKLVLEKLRDPLIHLLRNAIDHGIEDAATRKQFAKSAAGNIYIDVKKEGNQVLLDISDDGAGIDIKKISALALAKNIVTKPELDGMTEAEILELIFYPGFSTREIITNISGRGVGLDVVKANITHLKGNVSVTTELGKNTIFHVRVPSSLASDRGLLIKSGGQLFVIPTSSVERVIGLHAHEIIEVEAIQTIMLEQQVIPLRVLADVLNLEQQQPALQYLLPIVIINKNSNKVAFLVEEIIGEREIVIKPLQAPLVNIPCVTGGTLSGNGQVIIVLNANDLMESTLKSTKNTRINVQLTAQTADNIAHILVVDDSITTRTLEKNILEAKGYKVTVAVDGKEAWDLLQKQKFSLLITDIEMPIMNGFMLTERVKQHEILRNIPVIIVTSLDSDAEKKQGINAGADAYIVKNEFESSGLLEIVGQLV